MEACLECEGRGYVNKKVWVDAPVLFDVHPAILAGIPAQRTVRRFPCSRGCKEKK